MIWRFAVIGFLLFPSFGHAQTPKVDLVRVEKSQRTLYLMSSGKVLREYKIVLGGSPVGHKQREGDKRTPEGRYTLDFKKEDSAYFRAIHISYPNEQDKENARQLGVSPGGAIMIHGQPNKFGWSSGITQTFDWTEGCIALSNADMSEVWELVQVPIPIEIVP